MESEVKRRRGLRHYTARRPDGVVGSPAGRAALSYGMAEGLSTPAHDDLIPEEVNTRMLKKHSFWSVGVGALVLMTMLFAACGPSAPSGGNTGTIQKGGTVINGLYEEPDTLLPYLTSETDAIIILQALCAPLWHGANQSV